MKKDRAIDLLCQMIDCLDTVNQKDILEFKTTYDIIHRDTDITDSELKELDIGIEVLQKEAK